MLKIKDNVDLKELEKFGFHKYYSTWSIDVDGKYSRESLSILKKDRIIMPILWQVNEKTIDILFDLIQAGLVEKVEI